MYVNQDNQYSTVVTGLTQVWFLISMSTMVHAMFQNSNYDGCIHSQALISHDQNVRPRNIK